MTGHLRADDLEVDKQPLLIVHNLRLGGGDAEIMRDAVALVPDQDAERVRNGGLDLWCRWVVGEDVALVEILDVELRAGLDADGRRGQRDGDRHTVLKVAEGAADQIVGLDLGDRKSTRLNSSHLGISY